MYTNGKQCMLVSNLCSWVSVLDENGPRTLYILFFGCEVDAKVCISIYSQILYLFTLALFKGYYVYFKVSIKNELG